MEHMEHDVVYCLPYPNGNVIDNCMSRHHSKVFVKGLHHVEKGGPSETELSGIKPHTEIATRRISHSNYRYRKYQQTKYGIEFRAASFEIPGNVLNTHRYRYRYQPLP